MFVVAAGSKWLETWCGRERRAEQPRHRHGRSHVQINGAPRLSRASRRRRVNGLWRALPPVERAEKFRLTPPPPQPVVRVSRSGVVARTTRLFHSRTTRCYWPCHGE